MPQNKCCREEGATMGQVSMDIYLKIQRVRYQRGNRALKKQLLDEFCRTHGYHRKAAARLLRQLPIGDVEPKKRGRKKRYEPDLVIAPLKTLWLASDQMCGKRLKEAIPLWLPYYEAHHGVLSATVWAQLQSMSAATIDRLLKSTKVKVGKGLSGTKPGSLLRHQIPISTNQWSTTEVGFVEADTVAHCGSSLAGSFIWSITLTDIVSGWTEMRATWNKGAEGVLAGIQAIESELPFPLKGFDCDNGSEFLNWHLIRYFTDRGSSQNVQFTRSRPYKKEDNAHVEQKNWTHVRQLFGYHRLDNPDLVNLMNQLYANEVSLLFNFFYPCIKLLDKQRIQSKIIKKYDQPKTPYQRLIASNCLTSEQKLALQARFEQLDPFELQSSIQNKLKLIFRRVTISARQRKPI